MGANEDFARALEDGDYKRALLAYRGTEHAMSSIGKPTEAFLMSLAGDHDAAAKQMVGVRDANVIEFFVKGERDRTARWTDVKAASSLTSSEPLPYLGVYAGTAVALIQGDKALIEGAIAADKAKIPAVAGKLTFRDGRVREFKSIVDSDDGIGAMLETFGENGLLYMPFASLRSVTFHPPRTFMDSYVAKADVVLADGTETGAIIPVLYALSTRSKEQTIRTGRMTTWEHVGSARRGLGQRDFVLDGGVMVGMERVARIDLNGASAAPTVGARATPPSNAAPLPRATVQSGSSSRNPLVIGLVLLAIVVVLFLAMR